MVSTYIIVSTLLIISAISKAIQDKIQFHFEDSVFKKMGSFWDPSISWKRKYKDNDPDKGSLFPGSTTIFVSLTDAWHLFGLIRNFSIILSIAVASKNYWFIIGYILYFSVFHLFFTWVFKSK